MACDRPHYANSGASTGFLGPAFLIPLYSIVCRNFFPLLLTPWPAGSNILAMPDKPLTVLTYAASASLAAIALVYFFNPNYLIDGEALGASASARKKGVVGLSNPMNDCFINSVLQSLAGLRELRLYLIRELHRRKRGGEDIYRTLPDKKDGEKPADARKLLSLQRGEVTQGLKEIIDRLNERPLYRKTISAEAFIRVLEHAFETRISKAQQDAQELLQVIAERLCDEYHAAKDARKRAQKAVEERAATPPGMRTQVERLFDEEEEETDSGETGAPASREIQKVEAAAAIEEELGFPLEGRTESQIECQHCHFIPKPSPVPFVILTLSVPQTPSTTLDECFDMHFKTEIIDDYKCDRCRLDHALSVFAKDLAQARSEAERDTIRAKIKAVERSLADDPEKPPPGAQLPDSKLAPARRIARHVSITSFPRVLVIHLSRSIFDTRSSSAKNTARVSFPERLVIGGLLSRHRYKLLGVVTHKGTHNSGHYESFRRQHIYAPFSMPHPPAATGEHRDTPTSSPQPSVATPPPAGEATRKPVPFDPADLADPSTAPTTPSSSPSLLASGRPSSASTRPSTTSLPSKRSSLRSPLGSATTTPTISPPPVAFPRPSTPPLPATATPPAASPPAVLKATQTRKDSSTTQRALGLVDSVRPRSRRKKDGTPGEPPDAGRWWRISDDKVRECRTADVLGMQKEVYLLFYEMEPRQPGGKAG